MPAGRTRLRRLLEQMRAEPDTVEGVTSAARAKSALVAALPQQDVQRHIAALMAAVSSAYIDGVELGDSIHVADRLAEDRALQGIPLASLLEGFQAGRHYVMTQIFERTAKSDIEPAEVFACLIELDALANEMQNRLVQVYRETELSLTRTTHAVRLQALRSLLHHGPTGNVAAVGLDPRKRYHCIIADVSAPREARAFEASLTTADGLCGMVDGYLCAVSGRLPERQFEILLVAAPAVPAADLAGAYRLCQTALASARRRRLRGLQHLTSLALPLSVDTHPALGRMLATEHLVGLDPEDEFHQLLAKTALTYLEHGGRTDLVAGALHVHPNTVKHRLRRMAELTSFDPTPNGNGSLAHSLRWWWALQSWLTPIGDKH
ncbi:helix-turn-helix domain-containing protein [Kibdelosporangium philippinense]|uniref:Helix-turn-helix domain-containing protein n=1 Tax=Kibdelosporangium philippinense TaxID=211113 RepID=A0ABS8ZLD8_9PSEU|nr:helix-turn-helix domain-containing protein [Kibdelosporangium philippinense]MCE7007765.1 helix-turn-helix domain-containing protein [Kibdelosporangium philippinense]